MTMSFNQKINLTGSIIFIGTGISFLYHCSVGYFFGLNYYPYNTFLFSPEDRFMDFMWPFIIAANPYHIPRADFQNFPALYRLSSMFTPLGPVLALTLFLGLFLLGFFLINVTQLNVRQPRPSFFHVIAITFLSYPFLIAIDRANYEIVVFFCLYLYILLYRKYPLTSAFFLGIAVALKAFPAVMGLLLLADKRYQEIMFAALVTVVTTLVSYASFPGGLTLNVTNHLHNLSLYNATYAIGNTGMGYGNSLYGALKFILFIFNPEMMLPGAPDSLTVGYMILAVIALIGLSVYILRVEKSCWRKVALLVCMLNLLPLVSADYKLLHLFIPFYLFLHEQEQSSNDLAVVLLFSLLFIPKSYWHLPALPEASLAVLLNPILMLTIVILIIRQGLKSILAKPEIARPSQTQVI